MIDNAYFPLKPGTTLIYEGKTEKGQEHIEVVVTSDTKVIMVWVCNLSFPHCLPEDMLMLWLQCMAF